MDDDDDEDVNFNKHFKSQKVLSGGSDSITKLRT